MAYLYKVQISEPKPTLSLFSKPIGGPRVNSFYKNKNALDLEKDK